MIPPTRNLVHSARHAQIDAEASPIARKCPPVGVKQVTQELGVRYVLEGSVRKAGNRVRITGQLIDTTTGAHIWADRFDGALDDIFELQDQVASSVAGAIEPKLRHSEIERAIRKPTASLDAYDLYLRALGRLHKFHRRRSARSDRAPAPGADDRSILCARGRDDRILPCISKNPGLGAGCRGGSR